MSPNGKGGIMHVGFRPCCQDRRQVQQTYRPLAMQNAGNFLMWIPFHLQYSIRRDQRAGTAGMEVFRSKTSFTAWQQKAYLPPRSRTIVRFQTSRIAAGGYRSKPDSIFFCNPLTTGRWPLCRPRTFLFSDSIRVCVPGARRSLPGAWAGSFPAHRPGWIRAAFWT